MLLGTASAVSTLRGSLGATRCRFAGGNLGNRPFGGKDVHGIPVASKDLLVIVSNFGGDVDRFHVSRGSRWFVPRKEPY